MLQDDFSFAGSGVAGVETDVYAAGKVCEGDILGEGLCRGAEDVEQKRYEPKIYQDIGNNRSSWPLVQHVQNITASKEARNLLGIFV